MSDKLDEAIGQAFKELYWMKDQITNLKLTLGHIEELAKKNRDELKETKRKEQKEYEGV